MNCLNCNREFDKKHGHLCPKSRWTWGNEDVKKILEDINVDLACYKALPETSSICTKVFNESFDPSLDSSLSTQLTTGANQQSVSSRVSCSAKSDTCDNPKVSDIHAVPGPSRLSFYESGGSVSEEEFESIQYRGASNNEKPWKCNVCQKVFKLRKYLKKHMKIHVGDKKHKCHFCDKMFLEKNDLRRHLRIHTNEKPFTCDVCETGFKRKSHLDRHMNSHLSCKICEKSFTKMCLLNLHALKPIADDLYKCDICGKPFLHQKSLQTHKMKTHK